MTASNTQSWDANLPGVHTQRIGHASESSVDVLALLRTLWRRKWLLVFTALLGIAAGFLYVSRQRTVYESSCQLLVVKKHSGMETESVGSLSDYQNQLTADHLATEMDTIKSKLIIDRAIQIGKLDELPSLELLVTDLLPLNKAIIKQLKTTRGGKDAQTKNSNTINVSFQCYDPADSAEVLSSIVAAYQEFLENSSKDVGSEVVDLFKQAETTLQTQFKEKQEAYHKFLSTKKLLRNPNIDNAVVNLHTNRVLEFEAAKSKVQVQITDLTTSLARIRDALKENVPPEVIIHNIQHNEAMSMATSAATVESSIQSQLISLKIQEQTLLEKMGEGHPKVAAIRNQILEIRKQLVGEKLTEGEKPQDFLSTYISSLDQRLKELEQRVVGYQNQIDEEMKLSKAVLEDELQDRAMRDDVENTRLLGDAAVKRLQELNVIKDFGSYNLQILAEPEFGTIVGPRVLIILFAAALCGCFLGCGLVYLVENADLSFHNPQDVAAALGVPILGRIPTSEADDIETIHPGSHIDSSLATFHRPKSKFAESFRAVRTALFFNSNASTCRVIQMTSADPGDGKTTLSTNVAASIAQSGKRVVIIDADFRRPRIHSIFGLPTGSLGITSVIVGKSELDDATHATEIENLYCIPCGVRPPNPSELLTSPRFKELLEVLRERFDFVIVDTPPLLVVSDASVVAAYVDTTVLAVRLKKNGRPGALRASELLNGIGANLLGVVINGISPSEGYGYGYQYGGYQYSYNDDVYYEEEPEEILIHSEPRQLTKTRHSTST